MPLFLSGCTLCLTPPGVELYIFAVRLDGLIGAHAHIIFLLGGQLTDTLRSRLILADRHRLGFLKLTTGAVLHLVAGSLSRLLFPSDLKAFLGSFHLRHTGSFGVNVIGHGLTAAVIALEGHFYGVFAYILHTLWIADGIIRTVLQSLTLTVLHEHFRFDRTHVYLQDTPEIFHFQRDSDYLTPQLSATLCTQQMRNHQYTLLMQATLTM